MCFWAWNQTTQETRKLLFFKTIDNFNVWKSISMVIVTNEAILSNILRKNETVKSLKRYGILK